MVIPLTGTSGMSAGTRLLSNPNWVDLGGGVYHISLLNPPYPLVPFSSF